MDEADGLGGGGLSPSARPHGCCMGNWHAGGQVTGVMRTHSGVLWGASWAHHSEDGGTQQVLQIGHISPPWA